MAIEKISYTEVLISSDNVKYQHSCQYTKWHFGNGYINFNIYVNIPIAYSIPNGYGYELKT